MVSNHCCSDAALCSVAHAESAAPRSLLIPESLALAKLLPDVKPCTDAELPMTLFWYTSTLHVPPVESHTARPLESLK